MPNRHQDRPEPSGQKVSAGRDAAARSNGEFQTATAALARGRVGATDILALQRLAGNAAVVQMMEPERERSPVLGVIGRGGAPLEPDLRVEMEERLGSDFSDVRLHTGSAAAASAESVGAEAYTSGRDVVFGRGAFSPQTDAGKHTLAHELVHVVQQRQGVVDATPVGDGTALSHPSDRFERDAERLAAEAMGRNLQRQRTVGYRTVLHGNGHRPTPVPTVQRKLAEYEEFAKGARKMLKAHKMDESVFEEEVGKQGLDALRHSQPVGVPGFPISSQAEHWKKANISSAYKNYDRDPTVQSLNALYDAITYWEALNTANSAEPWHKEAAYYISSLKDAILREIQTETEREFGNQKAIDDHNSLASLRNRKDKELSGAMPDYMKKIGIAPRYYEKHLFNYPERVDGLYNFYIALSRGKLGKAVRAYEAISAVPGMYLIKPLIIHHFAGNADMKALVGTKPQGPDALTEEEAQAIITYSGGDYRNMNGQLRSWLSEADAPMKLEDFEQFLNTSDANPTHRSTSELVVSGLNKMPPYKGIAYRGLLTEPRGYFDVIQPGAMIVDLAFQSASPSMHGVEEFLRSYQGTKHVYFMIHTKSAVNIMGLSAFALEGEVLFKPGARFQVKAVWHHVGGKVPPNAPPEAQLILHSRGEFKSSWGTAQEVEKEVDNDNDKRAIRWHQVKVVEMVEV